jgi:hypothetical protein
MRIQFDSDKADSNLQKHGVSFEEGITVFDDPLALTIHDAAHSVGELRFLTIGITDQQHLVVISHTQRDG